MRNRFGDRFRVSMLAEVCIYCGEKADTKEHFPPASVTSKGWLFSCCRECNTLAGTDFYDDFNKRVNLVKSKLTNIYRKFINAYPYSSEELNGFTGNLLRECSLWSEGKILLNKRLAWSAQDYFDLIEQSNPFVLKSVDNLITTKNESVLSLAIESQKSKVDKAKYKICLYCNKEFRTYVDKDYCSNYHKTKHRLSIDFVKGPL